jgi:tetratricopeptide (TPR) repeat protein
MEYKSALATYEKILTAEPKHREEFKDYPKEGFAKEGVRLLMGEVDSLVQKKLMSAAVLLVQTMIDELPLNIEAKEKMASLLEAKGLFKEAAESYRAAKEFYLRHGEKAEADRCGKIADRLDPRPGFVPPADNKFRASYL